MNRSPRRIAVAAATGLAVVSLLSFGGHALRAATTSPADRSSRQVRLMARILDDVLIESRSWLVRGGGATQGLYLPDFGAVFQVQASTNSGDLRFFGPGAQIEVDENGDGDIVVRRKKDLREMITGRSSDKTEQDAAKLYEKGKDELLHALVDNAEVLAALPAGQSVVISVSLNDNELKEQKDLSRLLLRVNTDDLKGFAENRLSENDLKSRIKVEES